MVTTVDLNETTRKLLATDDRISIEAPTRIRNMNSSLEYYEFPTLCELHSYCQESLKEEMVFYIHTKTQDQWRQHMEERVLTDCAACLRDDPNKLVCGARFHHNPQHHNWCHFGGNFWMAQCSYIRRLNLPFFPELLDEIAEAVRVAPAYNRSTNQAGWPHDVRPYGRFFAEWWVTNDIRERPAHDAYYFEYNNTKPHHCAVADEQVCRL